MMTAGVLALASRHKAETLLPGATCQGVSFRLEPLVGEGGEGMCG